MQQEHKDQIKKGRLLKIIETQIDKDKTIVENRFTLNPYSVAPLSQRDQLNVCHRGFAASPRIQGCEPIIDFYQQRVCH